MNSDALPSQVSFIRVAFLCLAFFGFPLILGIDQYQQLLDEKNRFGARRQEILLEQHLVDLSLAEPWDYFRHLCRSWNHRIRESPRPLKDCGSMIGSLRRLFPEMLQFAVFKDRAVVTALTDIEISPDLARAFIRELERFCDGDSRAFVDDLPKFRRFFGPLLWRGTEIDASDQAFALSYSGKWLHGYFSAPSGGLSFIILAKNLPQWPSRLQDARISLEAPNAPHLRMRMIDLRRSFFAQERRLGTGGRLGEVLARAGERPGTFFPLHGRLWGQRTMADGRRLLIGVADGTIPGSDLSRRQAVVAALLLFLALSAWSWWWLQNARRSALTITRKLGGLFLFVVLIPLSLLGFAARGLLAEYRHILEMQTHVNQEQCLLEFDRRFLEAIGRLEVRVRRAFSSPVPPGIAGFREALRRTRSLTRRANPALAELIDERGKSLFHYQSGSDPIDPVFVSVIAKGARNLINDLNGVETGGFEGLKEQFIHTTAEMFGLNVDLMFSLISQNLGYLYELNASGNHVKIILHPVRDLSGRTRFIAVFAWLANRIQHRYITHQLTHFQVRLPGTALFAYDLGNGLKVRSGFRFDQLIKNRMKVYDIPMTLQLREEMNGNPLLVTGLRGRQLTRFQLWAASDDASIRAEIRKLGWRYAGLSLAMLIIALTVGSILARRFLEPVKKLANGVEALRNREFSHRIPVLDRDEMGRLSETFNGMLEGLEDLEVAGALQEQFFPTKPLIMNSWSIYGRCRPASRVGGDYFDFFPLDDRRMALMIGDVSGHGVSAALVVAMAKALVAHPANEFDPGEILGLMQEVFAGTLQQKKMMTCFFAVFDTSSGRLTVANAGHNYPYIVRGIPPAAVEPAAGDSCVAVPGKCKPVEIPGFPLGFRRRSPYVPQEWHLENEDWLLLYTDGFVEALDPAGKMIGYDQLEAALPGIGPGDAEATEAKLRAWFERQAAPGPLADDITLVVLRRALSDRET